MNISKLFARLVICLGISLLFAFCFGVFIININHLNSDTPIDTNTERIIITPDNLSVFIDELEPIRGIFLERDSEIKNVGFYVDGEFLFFNITNRDSVEKTCMNFVDYQCIDYGDCLYDKTIIEAGKRNSTLLQTSLRMVYDSYTKHKRALLQWIEDQKGLETSKADKGGKG